jgi:hypothetical protein
VIADQQGVRIVHANRQNAHEKLPDTRYGLVDLVKYQRFRTTRRPAKPSLHASPLVERDVHTGFERANDLEGQTP